MAGKTFAKPLKTAHPNQNASKNSAAAKHRALAALLESRTIVAAAQKAQIGESTLRRWLREDEDFQQQLRHHRQQALGHVALPVQQRAASSNAPPKPSRPCSTTWRRKKRVEPGRAAMLRTALDFAFRADSYNDLAERLDALERAAEDQKSGTKYKDEPFPARQEDQGGPGDTDLLAVLPPPYVRAGKSAGRGFVHDGQAHTRTLRGSTE
jgi:hypothetical protein